MKKLLIATAVLFTALPFTFDGITPAVSKAHAIIGRPGTPCRLRVYIAAMCGAPSASVPISVGAALTIATSRSTVPSFVVRCWQLRPPVGAALGEVGAGGDRQARRNAAQHQP